MYVELALRVFRLELYLENRGDIVVSMLGLIFVILNAKRRFKKCSLPILDSMNYIAIYYALYFV